MVPTEKDALLREPLDLFKDDEKVIVLGGEIVRLPPNSNGKPNRCRSLFCYNNGH